MGAGYRTATCASGSTARWQGSARATREDRIGRRGTAVAKRRGMRILWVSPILLAACGASNGDFSPGGAASTDASVGGGSLSSSECPTGFVCNDFHECEPPAPTGDAGVTPPPETEYTFGPPISSQRY